MASVKEGPKPALMDGNRTPVTGELEVFSKVILISESNTIYVW